MDGVFVWCVYKVLLVFLEIGYGSKLIDIGGLEVFKIRLDYIR